VKKIPTLFVRDPENRKYVLPEVTPGCEWVLAGEGRATRKWDGTCTMLDPEGRWWARREVKPGKEAPDGFVEADHDEVTGKRQGWEPVEQSAFAKVFATLNTKGYRPDTYELIGPKVNGNPEQVGSHQLIRHGFDTLDLGEIPADPEEAFSFLGRVVHTFPFEGVVWHHNDGRMVKLKRRDFPPSSTTPEPGE
jgi:hypothetical protein